MIKPSDKVLIGWITLLATFASANLGQVGASELNATNPEPSAGGALAAEQLSAAQGSDDRATVAAHGQSTALSQGTQTSGVISPSGSEVGEADEPVLDHSLAHSAATLEPAIAPTAPPPLPAVSEHVDAVANTGTEQVEALVTAASPPTSPPVPNLSTQAAASNQAKLNHLVATATREIPVDSSLLNRADKSSAPEQTASSNILSGETMVMRGHPSAAPELLTIPADALPTARVISPGSAVVIEPVAMVEPAAAVEEPAAVVEEPTAVVEEPVVVVKPVAVVVEPAAVVEEPAAVADEVVSSDPVLVDGTSGDVGGSEASAITADRPPLPVLPEMPTEALPTTRVMSPNTSQTAVESGLNDYGRSSGPSEAGLPRDRGSRVDAVSIQALKARVSQALADADAVALTETDGMAPDDGATPRGIVLTPDTASSGSEIAVDTAQLPLEPPLPNLDAPSQAEIDDLIRELDQPDANVPRPYQSSPAITISNPSGFGVDNLTAFVGLGYQERTRFANKDDGGAVVGIGFGDARENVGVQLSYTVASFGGSRDFGTGGFNAKIHKRLADDWSVALGWEGFATTGFVDFEDSIYGSVSHLIRTRENIAEPFSRVAVTAGVGNGRFRTEDAIFDDRNDVGVFGSVAVRVVEPVSAIVEWTGQDLAAGISITPFRDLPFVLLPAVRDITGAGDGSRFVLGAGISFQL